MRKTTFRSTWFTVAGLFAVLCFFRVFEFVLLRTDRRAVGESVLHLLLTIGTVTAFLRLRRIEFSRIGFTRTHAKRDMFGGALFAAGVFALAVGLEILVLRRLGRSPAVSFHVSKYIFDPYAGDHMEALNAFALVLGAVLTAGAEEMLFRGLFINLAEPKGGFFKAAILSSFLYGLWGYVLPLRYFLEGKRVLPMLLALGGMFFLSYFMQGVRFSLEYELTGSLWFPLADHLMHYVLMRILHVRTEIGGDELFLMRMILAQAFALIAVLIAFIRVRHFVRSLNHGSLPEEERFPFED